MGRGSLAGESRAARCEGHEQDEAGSGPGSGQRLLRPLVLSPETVYGGEQNKTKKSKDKSEKSRTDRLSKCMWHEADALF